MADVTVFDGDKLTLPDCTFTPPAGKEFDRWDAGDPGEKLDITSDCTITAIWRNKTVVPTTYNVTLDANNGSGTKKTETVSAGAEYVLADLPADFTIPAHGFLYLLQLLDTLLVTHCKFLLHHSSRGILFCSNLNQITTQNRYQPHRSLSPKSAEQPNKTSKTLQNRVKPLFVVRSLSLLCSLLVSRCSAVVR